MVISVPELLLAIIAIIVIFYYVCVYFKGQNDKKAKAEFSALETSLSKKTFSPRAYPPSLSEQVKSTKKETQSSVSTPTGSSYQNSSNDFLNLVIMNEILSSADDSPVSRHSSPSYDDCSSSSSSSYDSSSSSSSCSFGD